MRGKERFMQSERKLLHYVLFIPFIFTFAQEIIPVDTVFVTASRLENRIYFLPISSLLISKNDLTTKSIGDIASVLSGNVGIDVRNYSLVNGASSISLLGSTSQQVLVLLDGLPMNSPSVGTPDLGLLPLHILNRIEIVKGPTSSLYGANALGGVINLITEQPFYITKPSYEISLNYGTYHTSNLNFLFKTHVNNYNFILDGHYLKTNGLRTNDDGLMRGIGFASGYTFNSTNRLRLDLRYETKELGLPGPKPKISEDPLYGDSTAFTRYDRQSDTLYFIKFIGDWQIKPEWDISFNSHWRRNYSNFLWVNQWSYDTSLYQDRYDSNTLISNLISRYRFTRGQNVALGIDCEQNRFSGYSQFPQDTNWHPALSKIGMFSEGSFDFMKIFRAFGSLRLDWNSGFGTFLSPALGFTGKIIPNLKIRLHMGKAFRAPTLNDLYWPISGNTELKPEQGTAYQLGFDYTTNTNFNLSWTFFTRKTNNLISWQPDTSNIWRPNNIDSASITGIELNGKIRLAQGISLQFCATAQNAWQIRKEMIYNDWFSGITEFDYIKRKQAFLPNITFSPSLNIENELGTNVNIYGRYVSARYNYYPSYDLFPKIIMQTKKLPAYFVLSIHISQKVSKTVNLTLKVENLYDNQYSEQFGNSINDRDYPRPGRSVFMGFDIRN